MASTGGFTLPGEAGHEELTLRLAQRWGADVIRDSDGTALSEEILGAGYGIYSTICLIREDREWAEAHPEALQQNFLMSEPVLATGSDVVVPLLKGYSTDQFRVNANDGVEFWQVFDRTTGGEVPRSQWNARGDHVSITGATASHSYTVNFLAIRLWEEISMYNHVTNGWGDKPRLMALEPRHPAAADHMVEWLERWCVEHPETTVVRFTSLFYNFAWLWGSDPDLPHRYADWGSYDFTVNPIALREFNTGRAIPITSEDFVNAGRYTSTHNPPSPIYREWMGFVGAFVRDLGRRCVDVVHRHGKQAYVFYDDSWIGLEPWSEHFADFGFDGLIKAVFSGYEARMNAGVDVPVHELRLHPYLFPVNLEGAPTFAPGGDPTSDARGYWTVMRRALLRAKIDRIGLGGYLSLTEGFEDFQAYIAEVADEHRLIRDLHEAGPPAVEPVRIGVLTAWGALRSWTCSGHLHENPELSLLHVIESLAGLALEVRWLSLDEVAAGGVPADIDVLINAGPAGSAWSGGPGWARESLTAAVLSFVAAGGGLIGVQEPSALSRSEAPGRLYRWQLAPALGVDRDPGDRHVLARRRFRVVPEHPVLRGVGQADLAVMTPPEGVHLLRGDAEVLAAEGGVPRVVASPFGQGRAVYFGDVRHSPGTARALENAVLWVAGRSRSGYWSDNPALDVAAFEAAGTVVVANSTLDAASGRVLVGDREVAHVEVGPGGMQVLRDL